MRAITISLMTLILATAGCLSESDVDTSTAVDQVSTPPTDDFDCASTGACDYWFCFPSYTPCVDGACNQIGGCCTVETQENDCMYEACTFVHQCCPAQ